VMKRIYRNKNYRSNKYLIRRIAIVAALITLVSTAVYATEKNIIYFDIQLHYIKLNI